MFRIFCIFALNKSTHHKSLDKWTVPCYQYKHDEQSENVDSLVDNIKSLR